MKEEKKTGENKEELRQAILMLGYLCIASESEASLARKVQILDRFNLKAPDIAKICGHSVQSVFNARLLSKKKKKI